MGRICCVSGCTSARDAPAHQIPKNPELFKKWKSIIYSEKIQHLTDEQISKCVVCYRHFANEDYLVTYKVRKLKRGVLPSLNLPNRPVNKELISESDSNASTSTEIASTIKTGETAEEVETFVAGLFEDLPETLEPPLHKQSLILKVISEQVDQQSDTSMNEANLTAQVCETSYRSKRMRRKRARLAEEQLILLKCKKQAKIYAKTPTIQKLLSSLTATEKSSLQNSIRKSKYFPRAYIKLYHDIAEAKALGQL